MLVFSMLRDLVSFCREREKEVDKRFNFTLTTNGLLLEDEVIDWVIANDIALFSLWMEEKWSMINIAC